MRMCVHLRERPPSSQTLRLLLKGRAIFPPPPPPQTIIRAIHEHGTARVAWPGTSRARFVPVPLFDALDGTDPADYEARVEPSAQGGAKMARLLLDSFGLPQCTTPRLPP